MNYSNRIVCVAVMLFIALVLCVREASASCRSQGRGNFNIAKGFGMDSYRVSDGGGCGIGYRSGAGTSFTSASINVPPSNGTLAQDGRFHFRT